MFPTGFLATEQGMLAGRRLPWRCGGDKSFLSLLQWPGLGLGSCCDPGAPEAGSVCREHLHQAQTGPIESLLFLLLPFSSLATEFFSLWSEGEESGAQGGGWAPSCLLGELDQTAGWLELVSVDTECHCVFHTHTLSEPLTHLPFMRPLPLSRPALALPLRIPHAFACACLPFHVVSTHMYIHEHAHTRGLLPYPTPIRTLMCMP